MSLNLKIGSRSSNLARIQTQEIISLLGPISFEYEFIRFSTKGDEDKITSLTLNPGDDFFTNTLDQALLNKEIDIAIHSAKDLPQRIPDGLKIFALTKSIDDTDSWVSEYSLEKLPLGARVGTSSQLRAAMIKALKPDIQIVDIRGTIEERLELLKAKKIDGLIVASCALKRLGLEKHIQSILPWESMPLQGQLAIVGRQEDANIEKLFKSIDVRSTYGQVLLVGAGPGDPHLITLKAIEALKSCNCVFYDYLVDPLLLKYASKAEHIYVGKRKGSHTLSQEKLSQELKIKAMEGKKIVRLKGGDPLIFGRGADEIAYLRSYHIDVSVIPGVSSATSIPSLLGIPLTARNISSSVAFVSGHGDSQAEKNNKELVIPNTDTIVFLMGLTKLNQIVSSLLKAGWAKTKPIIIISNGTKPNQQILLGNLADIEMKLFAQPMEAPALIVAGETVNFYKQEPQKLLLHCGTHPENYTHLGNILSWPMIEIQPVSLNEEEKNNLIKDFDESDFVIITSPNAAEHFVQIILGLKSANVVRQKIFAVIGRSTAQILEDFGLSAQIISANETSQGLYSLLSGVIDLKNKNILLPRSSLPNPFLKQALQKHGAIVNEWTIYKNIKTAKRDLPNKPIEGVIFTSPSTLTNFLEDYGTIPASWGIFAKGPVTAKALQEAGYEPNVVNI